jgi:hypothetical protein
MMDTRVLQAPILLSTSSRRVSGRTPGRPLRHGHRLHRRTLRHDHGGNECRVNDRRQHHGFGEIAED